MDGWTDGRTGGPRRGCVRRDSGLVVRGSTHGRSLNSTVDEQTPPRVREKGQWNSSAGATHGMGSLNFTTVDTYSKFNLFSAV
jgi:hypothetical protein